MFKLSDILENKKINKKRTQKQEVFECFDFLKLIENWDKIVGEKLIQHTSPLKIQDRQLIVLTRHSVYSQQLTYMSEAIRDKIINIFPHLKNSIRGIKFISSESFFNQKNNSEIEFNDDFLSKQKSKAHKFNPHYQSMKSKAKENIGINDIEDSEIEDLLISLEIQRDNSTKSK